MRTSHLSFSRIHRIKFKRKRGAPVREASWEMKRSFRFPVPLTVDSNNAAGPAPGFFLENEWSFPLRSSAGCVREIARGVCNRALAAKSEVALAVKSGWSEYNASS